MQSYSKGRARTVTFLPRTGRTYNWGSGNMWQSFGRLRDDFSLRYGGGIGLNLDTVIGPVLLNYGRGQAGRDKFYVSVGVPF